MWYGIEVYVAVTAGVALVLHSLCRRQCACCLGGAAFCSVLNLFLRGAGAGADPFDVSYAPFALFAGFIVALAVFMAVGSLFELARGGRRSDA